MTIEELSKKFPSHHVTFTDGQGGLPMIRVDHPAASAEIYLQGAHLTHFQPAHEEPVLFVSSRSKFEAGAPIRGGVPICFPWFGPNAKDPAAPAHGFARIMTWQVTEVQESNSGVSITLSLESSEETRKIWPADFLAQIEFVISRSLEMKFRVTNRGSERFWFEEALHTYFTVTNVRHCTVEGLRGCAYIDKTDKMAQKVDNDFRIAFSQETDRLYLDTTSTCFIDDGERGLGIRIEKTGSNSTVVWNPFPDRAAQLKDIGQENWPKYVCVETANAGPNAVSLPGGQTHEMTATITVHHRVGSAQ